MTLPRPAAVVVLAAGGGTRMRSATPKVLHRIAGRGLLEHVLAAAAPLGAARTLVVVGAGRDQVVASLPDTAEPVDQTEQRGTGHAVRTALAAAPDLKPDDLVVVVPGDAPLLTAGTLADLVAAHHAAGAAVTLLSAEVADPFGYGRVVRGPGDTVTAVVEERDADAATRVIREVATSVYAFAAGPLAEALARVGSQNAQGEEYLTDVVGLVAGAGGVVAAHRTTDPGEVAGVNDRVQLAAAGRALNDRLLLAAMRAGVTVVDPATTWLDAAVALDADVTLLPGARLYGRTAVATGAVVGPDTTLTDTLVGAGATVASSTCTSSEIGPEAHVGPYSHLRAGTRLGARGKIGAFAETKAADLGAGTKVPHLAYVGDATVGTGANVGCGTVFVNYDGVAKHHTVVGDEVRLGSNTLLVAPVTVGDGAYTGGGALVTTDVPPGALALREGKQRTIEGWTARKRPGTPAAAAAARAHGALPADSGGNGESGGTGSGADDEGARS